METLWRGTLAKMRVEAADDPAEPVRYFLCDGWWDRTERVEERPLNADLDRRLELAFTGEIHCVYCGRATKTSFGQGFCYPCFQARAEADICIVKPELCHYHVVEDPCRDEQFALSQCFQPHVLYVSLTSGVKIGITRRVNIPSRWIDQGATRAIPLAELPSRREVGLVEKRLSDAGFADKTHWTRMLKGETTGRDLAGGAESVLAALAEWGIDGGLAASERIERRFTYPVLEYPTRVKSFNLDKTPVVGGRLIGIKGQYLIFDAGVINLRKYSGYRIDLRG
jgi:hypothetical protein